jgi:hypothetical protein
MHNKNKDMHSKNSSTWSNYKFFVNFLREDSFLQVSFTHIYKKHLLNDNGFKIRFEHLLSWKKIVKKVRLT